MEEILTGTNEYAVLPGLLLPWFREHRRDLPWRRDREPYHVWLSEIMLQQTRVEAVRGYYMRFLESCPDISALAGCDDEKLHKLWEGLGYYSRVRNLKKAARTVMERFGGKFPRDYGDIWSLPGIGDYTAGAIASICFEQAEPAVDGNVLRVCMRFAGDASCISEERTKRALREKLAGVYPPAGRGDFTQALMELGAIVCVPNGAPDCGHCPLSGLCRSRGGERWRELPVKTPKKERRKEELTVLILRCGDRYAIRRRGEKGLLAGLWEFPNTPGKLTLQESIDWAADAGCAPAGPEKVLERRHIFTHIEWEMQGCYLLCTAQSPEFVWASEEELVAQYSLPTAFRRFLGTGEAREQ